MQSFTRASELIERIYWLIKLRWIAVAGVIFTIFLASSILSIVLPLFPLLSVAIFIAGYNFFFLSFLKKIQRKKTKDSTKIANRVANAQISLDLVSLALLIHFSGGVENPFMFYFIFHMIIASILLSQRAAFLQASLATFLFCAVVGFEYFGILPHYPLHGFLLEHIYDNPIYVSGVSFVFVSTVYIAVYMASSVSMRLRDREKRLQEANLLLEEKDRAKSEYVLRVSHDIKEHLAAVQSCIAPVTEGFLGSVNPKQMDLLKRADLRTGKLLAFVKALLEISRLKISKKIKMENFFLDEVAVNAVNYVEPQARDKGISLSISLSSSEDQIKGVQTYIEETIANVLTNAIKYTPNNGKVNLKVIDQGSSFLIQVSDTGIGIPEDEQDKVFDEFYRAANAKKLERSGTGLGLSMAMQVIRRHCGKIWFESIQDEGSTFYILLPKDCESVNA